MKRHQYYVVPFHFKVQVTDVSGTKREWSAAWYGLHYSQEERASGTYSIEADQSM